MKALRNNLVNLYMYIKNIENLYMKFILTVIAIALLMIASNLSNGITIDGYTDINGSVFVNGEIDSNINGSVDVDGEVDAKVRGMVGTY